MGKLSDKKESETKVAAVKPRRPSLRAVSSMSSASSVSKKEGCQTARNKTHVNILSKQNSGGNTAKGGA